jgi:uncharacterized protein
MRKHTLRWRDWSGSGLEHIVVIIEVNAITAQSVLITPEDRAFTYSASLDAGWRARALTVSEIGGGASLSLTGDGAGRWSVDGRPAPSLAGALDIDLSASPFTNTLPIRRLGLAVGACGEISTAFVRFPELAIERDEQRYTRLGDSAYRYEALDGSFERDIIVDADGFVMTYPGLFARAGG